MDFKKVSHYISTYRIDRYFQASHKQEFKCVSLYKANLKVSQAFLPLLAVLEVVLRNGIDSVLAKYFGDPDWIITQQSGFMTDSALTHYNTYTRQWVDNRYLSNEVEKAIKRIKDEGARVTSGKVIAEQTLGFWTDLFEPTHHKLLEGRPMKVFTNLPSGHGRKQVYETLNRVRLFRNRVYHNEPICFHGNKIDFKKAEDVHNLITSLFQWIDIELIDWISDMDEVKAKIASAKAT